MKQSISGQAATAREQARNKDGKFGEQQHDRAEGIDLYDVSWMGDGEDGAGESMDAWQEGSLVGFAADEGRVFTDRRLMSRTPTDQWGKINNRYEVATGITEVSCEGHGGVGLSAERNAMIPEPLRDPDGWYEEDCEHYIVRATFPSAFQRGGAPGWQQRTVGEIEQESLAGVIRWYPDKYEQATGTVIPPGVSPEKDRREWVEAHKDDFTVASADRRDDGRLSVRVRRSSDGAETFVLMDRVEYDRGFEGSDAPEMHLGFVVDLERAELDTERIAKKEQEKAERARKFRELNEKALQSPWDEGRETLTEKERARLDDWKAGLVRVPDGTVMTRGEYMDSDRVTGVEQHSDGTWYANLAPESEEQGWSYVREIPAVVAKAAQRGGAEDRTSPSTRERLRDERRTRREQRKRFGISWG